MFPKTSINGLAWSSLAPGQLVGIFVSAQVLHTHLKGLDKVVLVSIDQGDNLGVLGSTTTLVL